MKNVLIAAGFLSSVLYSTGLCQTTQLEITDDSQACVYRDLCHDDAKPGPRKADDRTPYDKFREYFFPEMGIDPMREKYERLFDRPYPPPGNQQLEPDSPFTEVRKFDQAFDVDAVAGARTEVREDGGMLTVLVRVPDSAQKDLKISVNDERMLLALAGPQPVSPYRISKNQRLSIPNPPGVDPTTAIVDRRGDEIRISFMEAESDGEAH